MRQLAHGPSGEPNCLDPLLGRKRSIPPSSGLRLLRGCVNSIVPRKRLVALDDGTTVPIVRKPKTGSRPVHLPYGKRWYRMPRQLIYVRTCEEITLPSVRETPVRVTIERDAFLSIKQRPQLYTSVGCLSANDVMQCEPNQALTLLVENFSKRPRCLIKRQKVSSATMRPAQVATSILKLGNVLGEEPTGPTDASRRAPGCPECAKSPLY